MADQQFYPQCVSWGRTPDGRFFLSVDMQVTAPGKVVRVPVSTFIFTKQEEELLKATLTGLYLVTNGKGALE